MMKRGDSGNKNLQMRESEWDSFAGDKLFFHENETT